MNRTKGGFFSLLQIILLAFLLGSAASLYSADGFSVAFAFFLALSVAVSNPVFLGIYRRFGMLVSMGLMLVFGIGIFSLMEDPATALLTCTLCFAIPLLMGFFWPRFRTLESLTKAVLPLTGGVIVGGFLIYCKLHFGVWSPYAAVERMSFRMGETIQNMRSLYAQVYEGELLEQVNSILTLMVQNADAIAREMIFLSVYGLLGIFYFSILWADRVGLKQGQISGCGSWAQLIPSRSISWLYMLGFLILNFINLGSFYQSAAATFTFFGFYYVFASVYLLDRFLRKKQLPVFVRVLIAGLLFLAALFSAGNALFSPYSILMYVGWWIATSPRRTV